MGHGLHSHSCARAYAPLRGSNDSGWVCPLGLAGWLFDSAPSVPRVMARAKCSGLNIGQKPLNFHGGGGRTAARGAAENSAIFSNRVQAVSRKTQDFSGIGLQKC